MSANETTIQDPAASRGFFGHPVGLSTLFATEMWERFSFYGIRPLLILFMTTAVMNGGFGFERPQASAIVGIYAASVYLASLPGGWIADRLVRAAAVDPVWRGAHYAGPSFDRTDFVHGNADAVLYRADIDRSGDGSAQAEYLGHRRRSLSRGRSAA